MCGECAAFDAEYEARKEAPMAGETTRDALERALLRIVTDARKDVLNDIGSAESHQKVVARILDVVDLRAALSREDGTPWRPIETAPKDGSRFIAWGPHMVVAECEWRAQEELPPHNPAGWYRSNQHPRVYPTHWMPHPVGPALDTPEEGA